MDWTEEADAKVLALDAEGLTRREIAERMGVTRNAICGKLHRLKPRCAVSDDPTLPEPESDFVWPTLGKWQDSTLPKIESAPIVAPATVIDDETALEEIALALVEALAAIEEEPEAVAEPTVAPPSPEPIAPEPEALAFEFPGYGPTRNPTGVGNIRVGSYVVYSESGRYAHRRTDASAIVEKIWLWSQSPPSVRIQFRNRPVNIVEICDIEPVSP